MLKKKQMWAAILSVALIITCCPVLTYAKTSYTPTPGSAGLVTLDSGIEIYDDDTEVVVSSSDISVSSGNISIDEITPGQTLYLPLGDDGLSAAGNGTRLYETGSVSPAYASPEDLGDDDVFKISVDKSGTGKSLISSVKQVSNYTLDGTLHRGSFLKIVLKDSTTTDELKAQVDVTFKAKKNNTDSSVGNSSDGTWSSGDYATLRITMWINNTKISGSDGSVDTGDSIYFDPEANDRNTLVWGDDRAALEFDTDDDGTSFYAKLSTKSHSDIYTTYGDPVNAELYFYDFVGNPTIPSTSRATLTLGIPWDDDDAYIPDPEECYIYAIDADGYLTDITNQFTYSEDDYEIPGWSTRTRTLGTYVVSDTELDVDAVYDDDDGYYDDDDDIDTDTVTDPADDVGGYDAGDKVLPNTGSYDAVNLAAAAGLLSLIGAAAAATRKRRK